MTHLHEIADPIARIRAWFEVVQPPAFIASAVDQVAAELSARPARVASVTPLPFAPPAGCTCGTPAPVLHADGCPRQNLRDDRDWWKDEAELARGERSDLQRKAVEQAAHWAAELARAVAAARGPALVQLLACVDNAIARTPPAGIGFAQVPVAIWEALTEARNAYARASEPKPAQVQP